MPVQQKRTWFVICNAASCRIFQTNGITNDYILVDEFAVDLAEAVPEGASDHQGRVFDSSGSGRHKLEGMQPREDIKTRFLVDIAKRLNKSAAENAYKALIVVAPPRALGILRSRLSKHTQALISADYALDLTHLSPKDALEHLQNI